MVSTHDKWIRIFDVPEISKHKNGFTIYKVVSMLYPETCPDSVTKVTVWKRFNDFKKLNRELKVLHRKLNLKSKFPSLPSKTLFKRFDEDTIQERKQSILNFLEFIANNQQLFTSTEFVKFLETSHTPREYLTSNINLIRADLNLPEDPEVCTNLSPISDDEHTVSDTDSVTTMSSLSPSVQQDLFPENLTYSKLKKLNSSTSINSQSSSKYSDSLSITTTLDNITLLDGHMYPTPPNTPGSTNNEEYLQYIVDASVHISLAVELENSRKFEEAFTAYKTAIDILLKYGNDDPNYDRRQMVRYKTEKYLIKAERIYNMYLAPEVKNLHVTNEDQQQPTSVKRPLFDLYKFKVVKIIASGMLVLHSELQQLFYIKVIHKTTQFLNDHLILPENVPYMVKLHYHYNCENALFLVLDYCSGLKLADYLKNQSTLSDEMFARKDTQILRHIQEASDNDSELSFSELINDYNSKRNKNGTFEPSQEISSRSRLSSDDSYEKVEIEDTLPDDKKPPKNIMDEPLPSCEVEDLLTQSQRLITSVDTALTSQGTKKKYAKRKIEKVHDLELEYEERRQRKLSSQMSQVSSVDLEDFDSSLVVPEETVVKWAAQLLLALEKLHTLGVNCRSLQTKNILVNDKGDIVLTYMCNAKEFGDFFCDGINYNLAPEIYMFQEITPAVDWWSYGAILYELLVGMPLSEVHTNGINSFSHIKIPRYVSPESRSLLKQLLIYEPSDRLGSGVNGTENIKSHPFFHSISWNTLPTFH